MRCNTAQQLLHLHNKGERSDRQEHRLALHLRSCTSCRESATGGMSEYDSLLNTVRQALPKADSEDAIVRTVLARIAQKERNSQRAPSRYGPALSASLRYAAAMILVLIAGGFLFQFITVHSRLETLGRTLTDTAMPVMTMDIGYEIRTTPAELASLDSLCLPAAQAMKFAQRNRFSRDEAESLYRIAALNARCRRHLDASTVQRLLSVVVATPQLTLRIQEQGA